MSVTALPLIFQCRERGSSYTAQLQVSCKYTVNNGENSGVVLKSIGEVPIMVKVFFVLLRIFVKFMGIG